MVAEKQKPTLEVRALAIGNTSSMAQIAEIFIGRSIVIRTDQGDFALKVSAIKTEENRNFQRIELDVSAQKSVNYEELLRNQKT
jgi:hypothetical protein